LLAILEAKDRATQLGLIVGQRTGRQVIYALHDDHVAALLSAAVFHTEHLRLAASRPLSAPQAPLATSAGVLLGWLPVAL
jgi:hypothetical protein